jgi:peptide/nickel transport system substrate-binding protein
MGPDGEEVNVHDLIVELGTATEFERQQDLIQTLAYVLNEDVRMWPYLEKQIGIYIDHGTVDGWPEQGDPYWSMCPGGIEKFYTWMMVTGQLVPAAE